MGTISRPDIRLLMLRVDVQSIHQLTINHHALCALPDARYHMLSHV